MTLAEEVTFESLGAIRDELREWLGPDSDGRSRTVKSRAQRDVLVSVLIDNLAQELSDVHVRAQIQALLADLSHRAGKHSAD